MTFPRLSTHAKSIVLFLTAIFALAGCAKKEESARVALALPDWEELRANDVAQRSKVSSLADSANLKIERIVINITGPGIAAPIFKDWEAEFSGPVPQEIVIPDVPRGSDRLIQVLALFEDGGSTAFYYGDKKVALNSAVVTESVTIRNEAVVQSLVQGRMSGRFMNGANSGYTGAIRFMFNPPSGAPAMIAHRTEMFSGWGDLFAFSSNLISYTDDNGRPKFVGWNNASSKLFTKNSPKAAARIHLPGGFEDDNHDSGRWNMKPVVQERLIVGYFNDGFAPTADHKVCVPNTAVPVENRYKTADVNNPTAAPNHPISWIGHAESMGGVPRDATLHAYVEAVNDPFGVPTKGGDEDGACVEVGDPYSNYINLHHGDLGHGDDMIGIRGPFRKPYPHEHNVLMVGWNGTNAVDVLWAYLPGVQNDLSGVSLFYRAKAGYDVWDDRELRVGDGFKCSEFAALGFSEISYGIGTTEGKIPNITSLTQASNLQILLCPKGKNGQFYSSAAATRVYGQGGGPSPGATATSIEIAGALRNFGDPDLNANVDICQPLFVRGLRDGSPASFAQGERLIFESTTSSLHKDSYCDVEVSPSGEQVWGEEVVFYFRSASQGPSVIKATMVSNPGSPDQLNLNYTSQTEADMVYLVAQPSIYAHSCYPVHAVLWDSTNKKVAAPPAGVNGGLNFDTMSDLKFYYSSDASCSSVPTNSAQFSPKTASPAVAIQSLNMKYVGSHSGPALNLMSFAPSIDIAGISRQLSSVHVTQPGSAIRLQVQALNQFEVGQCIPLSVNLVDSNGRFTPNVSAAISASYQSNNSGEFRTYVGYCQSSATPVLSIAVGDVFPTARYGYVPSSVGAHRIAVTMSSGPPTLQNSYIDINVTPKRPTSIMAIFPGETFVSGLGRSGTLSGIVLGSPITVELYAVAYDGGNWKLADGSDPNIATYNSVRNFSSAVGGNLTLLTSPGNPVVDGQALPVTFVNGKAELQMQFSGVGTLSPTFTLEMLGGPPDMLEAPYVTVTP